MPSKGLILAGLIALGILAAILLRECWPPRSAAPRGWSQGFSEALDRLPDEVVELPPIHPEVLRQRYPKILGKPLVFAEPFSVDVDPNQTGQWRNALDGGDIWQIRIYSPGAISLNFGFTEFALDPGMTLHIWSEDPDRESFIGPFTHEDNEKHGQLWTIPVPGSRAVIELYSPISVEKVKLKLTEARSGFRNFALDELGGEPAYCHNNIACAPDWGEVASSVGVISVDGRLACTGTLLMNTRRDFKPLFLTAHHCGITPSTASELVVVWNREVDQCESSTVETPQQWQSGSYFRASSEILDFTLVELDDMPLASFDLFYSGWERATAAPNRAVGIHHPAAGPKSISFEYNRPSSSCESQHDNLWAVTWDSGIAEGGSSGSGLWTYESHRLVAYLQKGSSACNGAGKDCYLRFSEAWDGVEPNKRLKDWLDPDDLELQFIDGSYRAQ